MKFYFKISEAGLKISTYYKLWILKKMGTKPWFWSFIVKNHNHFMISSQNMDWKNTLIWWIRIPLSWRIHRLIRDRWTTGGWSWCPGHFWTRIRACRRRFWGKWMRIYSVGGGFSKSKMIRNSWRNRTNASRQHELVPFVAAAVQSALCLLISRRAVQALSATVLKGHFSKGSNTYAADTAWQATARARLFYLRKYCFNIHETWIHNRNMKKKCSHRFTNQKS